jgi:hypothetical protein
VNPPPPASIVAAIADLAAWARQLTEQGRHGDPAERAAYQAAKTNLLAHLTASADTEPAGQPDPRTATCQETA